MRCVWHWATIKNTYLSRCPTIVLVKSGQILEMKSSWAYVLVKLWNFWGFFKFQTLAGWHRATIDRTDPFFKCTLFGTKLESCAKKGMKEGRKTNTSKDNRHLALIQQLRGLLFVKSFDIDLGIQDTFYTSLRTAVIFFQFEIQSHVTVFQSDIT